MRRNKKEDKERTKESWKEKKKQSPVVSSFELRLIMEISPRLQKSSTYSQKRQHHIYPKKFGIRKWTYLQHSNHTRQWFSNIINQICAISYRVLSTVLSCHNSSGDILQNSFIKKYFQELQHFSWLNIRKLIKLKSVKKLSQ